MRHKKENNYRDEVYRLVRKIPKGYVTTYGEIARILKIKNSKLKIDPRMVGWALHANGLADVPCHRVVDRNGRIAPNYGGPSLWSFGRRAFSSRGRPASGWGGWEEQKRRLEAEGVKFVDEMHVDLAKHLK